MDAMKCPGCGIELKLMPMDSEDTSTPDNEQQDEVSMEDAQTMPLDKLKNKINKNAAK